MKSFQLRVAMLAVVTGIAVTGCSDSSDRSPEPPQPAPAPAPAPEPTAVDFTGFVLELFDATADGEPESVGDKEFDFADQDNPDAFSGLLSGS